METLIRPDGGVNLGWLEEPVDLVNYADYRLETPLGWPIPRFLRRLLFNQFLFIGVTTPRFIVGLAVVDLKYLGNGFFYVLDRSNGRLIETSRLAPPGNTAAILPRPDRMTGHFRSKALEIELETGQFRAHASRVGIEGRLDLDRAHPFRQCSRAGYRGWVFKQSTTPCPLGGRLTVDGTDFEFKSPEALGLVDWSCGYMRRETFWNWAAGAAALPDGRLLGFNFSCGVNETSFTENYFQLGDQRTKVDSMEFYFDSKELTKPWRIRSMDGRVNLTFFHEGQRGERVNALLVKSRFTQLMGTYGGTLITAQGETLNIVSVPGWAEDHYAKW